eukprot:GHVL01006520.1.p1 GENE.GHVL01006520.1~~GHVL01006520.1.p1  ORF type:complete len:167 (+),score=30.42 GHVL01006520.1:80-580(+)
MKTYIYYYIPSDSDDIEYPNIFTIPKDDVKLSDIKKNFPLPGRYHFRFKIKQDSSFAWLDITNDDAALPTFQQKIIIKVLRMSWVERQAGSPKAPIKTLLGDFNRQSEPKKREDANLLDFADVPFPQTSPRNTSAPPVRTGVSTASAPHGVGAATLGGAAGDPIFW